MDVLYYSNFCKHSQKIIQFLSRGGLLESISAICIDKRSRDEKTNQLIIICENGQRVLLPPNIQSVPALLFVNKNYQVILGEDIIQHFEPAMRKKISNANLGNGEPFGYSIQSSANTGGSNIVSEQFTFYDMSPEELSAKGNGAARQMYNHVAANQESNFIQTPPDTYKPDKIGESITIDQLQHQRSQEVPNQNQAPQYTYNTMDFNQ